MNTQMTANDQMASHGEVPFVGAGTVYRIAKQGGRPNVFTGTELAMAMSFTPGLPYWYEINLYRRAEQGFVVAIRKFYQSEDERDTVKSWSCDNIGDALTLIEDYDASEDVRVPQLDVTSESAASLAAHAMSMMSEVASARSHYAGLVGEMFAEIEAAGISTE